MNSFPRIEFALFKRLLAAQCVVMFQPSIHRLRCKPTNVCKLHNTHIHTHTHISEYISLTQLIMNPWTIFCVYTLLLRYSSALLLLLLLLLLVRSVVFILNFVVFAGFSYARFSSYRLFSLVKCMPVCFRFHFRF